MTEPQNTMPEDQSFQTLSAFGNQIKNIGALLGTSAPDTIKDKHRAEIAKIRESLWLTVEQAISLAPESYKKVVEMAQDLDQDIGKLLAPATVKKVKEEPALPEGVVQVTLQSLTQSDAKNVRPDIFADLLKALGCEDLKAPELLDLFLVNAAGQAFSDRKAPPPVLNLVGSDQDTQTAAMVLSGMVPVTPSRFRAKGFEGVVAALRGVDPSSKLPDLADHKGRRYSWLLCSNAPIASTQRVFTVKVGKTQDVKHLAELARDAWALAASSPENGTEHDVIGRLTPGSDVKPKKKA